MSREELHVLAEFDYELGEVERGYTNRTLYVNVSANEIESRPVSPEMKDVFIGGKGFGLYLLWHGVTPDTKWNDPENEIVIASGPLGGTTTYPGSGKSIVVAISPTTHSIIDSNVGGHFGPLLKFAGWDALELQGRAEGDVIVYIDGTCGKVFIYEAPEGTADTHELSERLIELFADSAAERVGVSSVSAGSGAEHALIGCLNFSLYDERRKGIRVKQAGRGGIGTVFRDKKIKAVVVKQLGLKGDSNHPSDKARIDKVGIKMHKEIHDNDPTQCTMRSRGTSYLTQIMCDYDLLPTNNFKYGSHDDVPAINGEVWLKRFAQGIPDGCWYGCTMGCSHTVEGYTVRTGPYKGQVVRVDGPEYETIAGVGSNCGIFDPEAILEINFYCDTYGLDTISFGTLTGFVMECYEAGILDQEKTGGLELRFGSTDEAIELLHQIASGTGFGAIAGQGVRRMKQIFSEEFGADPQFLQDIGMEAKGLEFSEYVTKESLAQQGGYGLANKGPQHDEAWLIFMDLVNNQLPTFEDKAEALHYFPMWRTWFGLCGLCKLPWNDVMPTDNALTEEPSKVPEHVQNYVEYFVGVTGREGITSGDDLVLMSEAVYNFQRVFNLRLGYGRREHDAIPYRSVGPVTAEEYESRSERYDKQLKELVGVEPAEKNTEEKIAALRQFRERQYQRLTDAVYKRRGWTDDGVPTVETLRRLRIDLPGVVETVLPHLG